MRQTSSVASALGEFFHEVILLRSVQLLRHSNPREPISPGLIRTNRWIYRLGRVFIGESIRVFFEGVEQSVTPCLMGKTVYYILQDELWFVWLVPSEPNQEPEAAA